MATTKQKLAASKIVENRGNVSKSMRQAGYSPKTAKNPKNLTKSKGFAELCRRYGLTDSLLIRSLVADIKSKPGSRKQELELAAKLLGRLEKSVVPNEKSIDDTMHHLDILDNCYLFPDSPLTKRLKEVALKCK